MKPIDWKLYQQLENPYQVIPIEFLRWTYQNRIVNPVGTWVYLKMVSKGIFRRLDAFKYIDKYDILNMDRKTLKTHLKTLERYRLIRPVGGGVYVISGYRWIHQSLGFRGRTSVGILPHDITNFRQFAASAVIAYHAVEFGKNEVYRKKRGGFGAVTMLNCETTGIPQFSAGVSVGIIAQQLGVSKGLAQRIKKQCVEAGYLKVQNQFVPVDLGNVSVSVDNLPALREFTDYGYTLKIRNGEYCQQVHDSITHTMELKRKSTLRKKKEKGEKSKPLNAEQLL